MPVPHKNLTIEDLKACLSYDLDTGIFTWIARAGNVSKIGATAGGVGPKGYVVIGFARKLYRAHRLAWLYMTGSLPVGQIDHINGDKTDNRFANLRQASNAQNQQNVRSARKHNKSQLLGVTADASGFRARIRLNNQSIYLGYFPSAREAHDAYLSAKRRIHEFGTL